LIAINGELISGNTKPHFISTLESKSKGYTIDDLWYEDRTAQLINTRGMAEVRRLSRTSIPVILSNFEIANDYAQLFIPLGKSDYELINNVFGRIAKNIKMVGAWACFQPSYRQEQKGCNNR
jgi:hypothetical protein